MTPTCPRCGSTDGALGTSYAYFMCRRCSSDGGCVYWTADHLHPQVWQKAIDASPWARARQALEQPGQPQPTVEQCAVYLESTCPR
jgi:hypothetical protein